jgi:hypothetical protein
MSTIHDAQAVVRKIYELGFDQSVEAAFDECYAPDFVHHSKVINDVPAVGEGEKPEFSLLDRPSGNRHFYAAAVPDGPGGGDAEVKAACSAGMLTTALRVRC